MPQAIIVAGHKGGDETIQEVLWGSLRIKVSKDKKSAVLRVRRLAGKRLTFVLEAEDERCENLPKSPAPAERPRRW